MKAIQGYDGISVGGGQMLQAGAYIVRIQSIEDHTDNADFPHLDIYPEIYDVKNRRFTNTDELADDSTRWRYRFTLSMAGEWGTQRYKRLVSAVERSSQNNGFAYQNADGAEQTLVGKWVGMVVRHHRYTKNNGADGIKPEVSAYVTCDDVISGNYKPEWTETRDTRSAASDAQPVHAPTAQVMDVAADDIPF